MMPDEVYVVFSDRTDLWWLKFLRHGFRHCFVILRFTDIWMVLDPLAHKTELMRIDVPDAFSLVAWLEGEGDRVVKVPLKASEMKVLPPALCSCVETVKRILGIRAPFVFTPWQLFTHLQKINERNSRHGKFNLAA